MVGTPFLCSTAFASPTSFFVGWGGEHNRQRGGSPALRKSEGDPRNIKGERGVIKNRVFAKREGIQPGREQKTAPHERGVKTQKGGVKL